MAVLQIIYAPNPIFGQKAKPVKEVNDQIRKIVDDMFDTLYFEKAVGIGANMVGILKRIIVVDMQNTEELTPYCMINPEIIYKSEEMQTKNEASLSFPGISAEITRPQKIKVNYLDYDGNKQTLEAEGLFATVIQHEMDYLDGKIFLDYLSKMKKQMLIKKMNKYIKLNPPHIHTAKCNH